MGMGLSGSTFTISAGFGLSSGLPSAGIGSGAPGTGAASWGLGTFDTNGNFGFGGPWDFGPPGVSYYPWGSDFKFNLWPVPGC
jgi:hypothetical protein